ncbi:unnamed protein product [Dibothriocephalus latus]|uniref:Uncharacterized protein n=1 Tax=Dibothriocephalus latus TaxID=60516 RepID=A0A3P6QV11_DIBLA|nr:unnamed protein product [Dibothriocephalus latus]
MPVKIRETVSAADGLTSPSNSNRNPAPRCLRGGGTNPRCRRSSIGTRKRCPPSSQETFQPIRLIIRLGRDTPTAAATSGGDGKMVLHNVSGTPPSDSPISSPNAPSKGSLHEDQLSPPSASVSLSSELTTRNSSQDMSDLDIVFLVAPEAETFIDSNQARVRRLRNQAMEDVYGHTDTNHDEDNDGDDSSSSDEMPRGPGDSMREATARHPQVVHTYHQASHIRENSQASEHPHHQLYRQQENHLDKVKGDHQPPPSSGINYRNFDLRSDDALHRDYSFHLEVSTTTTAVATPSSALTVSQSVASQQLHFQTQLTDLGSGHSSPPTTLSPR